MKLYVTRLSLMLHFAWKLVLSLAEYSVYVTDLAQLVSISNPFEFLNGFKLTTYLYAINLFVEQLFRLKLTKLLME